MAIIAPATTTDALHTMKRRQSKGSSSPPVPGRFSSLASPPTSIASPTSSAGHSFTSSYANNMRPASPVTLSTAKAEKVEDVEEVEPEVGEEHDVFEDTVNSFDEDAGNDDDIIYALKKHTFTTLVEMYVTTDIIKFEDLPEASKLEPTRILTWARRTPEFLFLETILPPSCEICLAALRPKPLQGPDPIQVIPGLPAAVTFSQQKAPKVSLQQEVNDSMKESLAL